jgi:membrane-associated HD superfamily phosphohydrolase
MSKLRDRLDTVRPGLLRSLAVIITVIGASIALIAGQLGTVDPPAAGEPAPETYTADRVITVPNEAATEQARDQAEALVPTVYTTDPEVPLQVQQNIEAFFNAVTLEAYNDSVRPADDPPEETTTTTTTPTSTTLFTDEGGEATIVVPDLLRRTETVARAELAGLQLNTAIGEPVEVTSASGNENLVVAQNPPAESLVTPGSTVTLQLGFVPVPPTTTTTTTTLVPPTIEDQELRLAEAYGFLPEQTRSTFIEIAQWDLDSVAAGSTEQPLLDVLLADINTRLTIEYAGDGIRTEELTSVLSAIRNGSVTLSPRDWPNRDAAAEAAAELMIFYLEVNVKADADLTEADRREARALVESVNVEFLEGQDIVKQGDIVSDIEAQAIAQLLAAAP